MPIGQCTAKARREDFGLADLFGAHTAEPHAATNDANRRKRAGDTKRRYLRLMPESSASFRNGWSRFEVNSVLDHEAILIQ